MKNFRLSTKLLMGAAIALASSVSLTSCSDDDDDNPTNGGGGSTGGAPEKVVGLDITSNTTWSKDTIYILSSRIKVKAPATLTIQAGTIIKGAPGQESNAKVLMILRGAKIIAEGTATEPIIFTSTADKIQPGQIASPNLDPTAKGLWGGLAILGNARQSSGISDPNGGGFDVKQIEGVPASDTDGLYGGNNDADNSGILKYVSVRHAGTSIGSGNELNGISLGAIGTGTIIENIEVIGNQDDGVEFFGGTVNAKNIVVWNVGDDGIDTDQAYNGTVDNFYVIGAEGSSFELDGPEGTFINGDHTLINGTVSGVASNGALTEDLLNYDATTNVTIQDVHFTSVQSGQLINSEARTTRVATFSNLTINVPSGLSIGDFVSPADPTVNTAVSVGTTSKASSAPFSGWSWASVAGGLN